MNGRAGSALGRPKFNKIHLARLKGREGLATQPGVHLDWGSRGLNTQHHVVLQIPTPFLACMRELLVLSAAEHTDQQTINPL